MGGLRTWLACTLLIAAANAVADPMRPLAASAKASAPGGAPAENSPRREFVEAPKTLGRLIAIRQDSRGQRQALIGERWVGVGERIDHRTVLAIGINQVELIDSKASAPSTATTLASNPASKPLSDPAPGPGARGHITLHLLPPLQASTEPTAAATTVADAARGTGQRRAGSPSQ